MDAEQIQKLGGNPGDVFVISVPKLLTPEAARNMCESWERATRGTNLEGCRVIVAEEGAEIHRIDRKRESEIALIVRGAEAMRSELDAANRELARFRAMPAYTQCDGVYDTKQTYIVPGAVLAEMCDRAIQKDQP